ncbi:diaminobutyrate acetyltransferase [Virgibacillus alimentarius]|uniref:L-2,4-diaminobutyric acid acetyltransferase n=1 Tax=Virgibacillus alimentarius TaxID=698769 RepID=A0ABS4S7E4_9BACI|nr:MULTISPECIES: diaminobutyrate acetyltransferase [Virgibacillus]MBP2256996.1 L-2,4-diaminobutyric acid acetyltransferase [Virgibacillus alimentarius]HLR68018.1 diaminobutyrate acetyltransferase [Virgibacillus sp.]
MTQTKTKFHFRKPNKEDGAAVWELIKGTGVLDLNSSYSYVMWCEIFSDTSIVAERDGEIVGFISGFIHPDTPNTLFIWQVAVNQSQRGQGLGTKMLFQLLRRDYQEAVHYLEATVSPSNTPSNNLFWGLSRKLDSNCVISDYISSEDFPEDGHEDELLFRIGPIQEEAVKQ